MQQLVICDKNALYYVLCTTISKSFLHLYGQIDNLWLYIRSCKIVRLVALKAKISWAFQFRNQYQIYKCGVKESKGFKNEFLKNVLLKDWIKNSKYLIKLQQQKKILKTLIRFKKNLSILLEKKMLFS